MDPRELGSLTRRAHLLDGSQDAGKLTMDLTRCFWDMPLGEPHLPASNHVRSHPVHVPLEVPSLSIRLLPRSDLSVPILCRLSPP